MSCFQIVGAKGHIADPRKAVECLQGLPGGPVLALNADLICGAEHLQSAAEHALRSFDQQMNACNNLAMECFLYASGERQISKAQEKLGLKFGTERVALVLFGPRVEDALSALGLRRDDSVLDASVEKAVRFGIEPREIEALGPERAGDLVLERVAFVDILKR
jgi:KEOPS complex subunit Cgi121